MARRHDHDDDDNSGATSGNTAFLRRRTFLTVAGAGALAGLVGATGRSRAAEVDLGAEGLSPGDDIDPYLSEHFRSGNDVYIPAGEYRTEMEWWDTDVSDASIRGDPAGVKLRRPDGFWTDKRLSFDGHVVVENITFAGRLGHGRHRLRCDGQSGAAHIEFRNVNDPAGSIGASDAIFMRAEGSGRIEYKWCYLESYPNSAFYQLENRPRMVFDGCTFRNTTNIHRGGSDQYTVRNCLYISDGDAPDFCENDNASEREDCAANGDDGGGLQRFFKFDQGYAWSGGTVENLHYYCEEVPNNGPWMDFQSESAGTGGTMNGLYVYNESGQSMFRFDGSHDWDVSDVHMSGPGNTSTPGFFDSVATGDSAEQPVRDSPVWTPDGEGMPLVDSDAPSDQPTPPPDDEPDGSVFEIVSTSDDAELEYEFEVDGSAEPTESDPSISAIDESNVTVAENGDGTTTVTGKTGFGYGDAFEINSHVTAFERTTGESSYELYLGGEDVTDQFADGESTDPEESVFEIVSTNDDAELEYEFEVDGSAEPTETDPGISAVDESNVTVAENGDGTTTVTGKTGFEYGDAFTVSGDVTAFERTTGEGSFQLLLDGEDVTDQFADGESTDPEESVFEIVSTNDDAELEYEFEVDGSAEPTETDPGISAIDESNVTVAENGDGTTTVTGKTGFEYGDAFTVSGDVTAFERTTGDASFQLLLDGEDVTDEVEA